MQPYPLSDAKLKASLSLNGSLENSMVLILFLATIVFYDMREYD
jgi:hypothetical protein